MNCICILKEVTVKRLEDSYKEELNITNIDNIEKLRYELSMGDYDFAILDYNNYNYHDLKSYLEEKNIDIYFFKGKFDELEGYINTKLENNISVENEVKTEVRIIEKYIEIEKEVEVEKIVEVEVEKEVEKIVEKKVYNKVKIVVASEKKGIGCTHYCFSIANHLRNKKYNVAIVEIGISYLSNVKSKIDILNFATIDEYYSSKKVREYDYIILDLGYYERDNFKELFSTSDFKIVIMGSKEWEESSQKYFFKYIGDMKLIKDLYYIFNFANDKQFEHLSNDMYGLNCYKGAISDCMNINNDMEKLIDNILDTYLEVNNKNLSLKIFNIVMVLLIIIIIGIFIVKY